MLLKSCRCGKLIPQSMKMCEECEQRQQSRHMIYNNTRRDERAAEFYVSKEWRAMRERIIEVYDNIDIYALYVEHELLTCNPVHHIIELEDDWEQRLNPFNLIPLNHKTHNTRRTNMTDWKKVTGTQPDKPEEVDRTSSPSTVYLRKNIEQVTREVEGSDGKMQTVTEWQYDEKEMTVKEYENMALMKSVVEENTSGIVESVTQFQKDAVIDEYTQQLIEEGLI